MDTLSSVATATNGATSLSTDTIAQRELLSKINDTLKTHKMSDSQTGLAIIMDAMAYLKQEAVPAAHNGTHPLVQDTSGCCRSRILADNEDFYTIELTDVALTVVPVLLLSRLVNKYRQLIRNISVRLKPRDGDFSLPFQRAFVIQIQVFYDFVEMPRRQSQLELYQYHEWRKTVGEEKLQQLATTIQQKSVEEIAACRLPPSFFTMPSSQDRRRLAEIATVVENMSESVDQIDFVLDYDVKLRLYQISFEGVTEIDYPFLEFFTSRFATRIAKLSLRQIGGQDRLALDVYADVERDSLPEIYLFTNRYVPSIQSATTGVKRKRQEETNGISSSSTSVMPDQPFRKRFATWLSGWIGGSS